MDKVKVSVITPCYNVEEYISESLDSVLSQSLSEIELICIDDGSTDGTLSLLKAYAENDPRIVVIEQENSGPSVGRNKALAIAQGKYISFVDSDDLLAPDAYRKCYEIACEYKADVVHFNAEAFFDNKDFEEEFKSGFDKRFVNNYNDQAYIRTGYERYNDKENPTSGPALFSAMYADGAYRTPIWLCFFNGSFLRGHQFRFIDGILHADDDFTFKTFLSAKSSVFLGEALYRRRFRPGSIMTNPIGRKNAVSRIIGQTQMQAFLEGIAPGFPAGALDTARRYLHDRRKYIADDFLQFLSDSEEDSEYKKAFYALKDYAAYALKEHPTENPPSVSSRISRKLKGLFR